VRAGPHAQTKMRFSAKQGGEDRASSRSILEGMTTHTRKSDGYQDHTTNAITKLRQASRKAGLVGSRILVDFVDAWIEAGKPPVFTITPASEKEIRSYVETIDGIAGLVADQIAMEATGPTHPPAESQSKAG